MSGIRSLTKRQYQDRHVSIRIHCISGNMIAFRSSSPGCPNWLIAACEGLNCSSEIVMGQEVLQTLQLWTIYGDQHPRTSIHILAVAYAICTTTTLEAEEAAVCIILVALGICESCPAHHSFDWALLHRTCLQLCFLPRPELHTAGTSFSTRSPFCPCSFCTCAAFPSAFCLSLMLVLVRRIRVAPWK